ncbi:TPA: DUF551 domain-containing protein [Klebsiella pneumoniae]|nr:DUF551 domain-containing protein [Klebsiella pneumoniae]
MPPAQPAADSEPVAIIDQANLDYLRSGADADVWPPEREEMGDVLLYRHAQPAPVVPEEWTIADAVKFCKETGRQDAGAAMDAWNACRAAMLQAGNSPAQSDCCPAQNHVSPEQNGDTPAKNQGWIPVSERMPEEGGRYWCYVEEQNSLGKSHYQWNCSWNGDVWSDKALTGRVTHWMPLPAAPQEAINALISVVSRNEPEGK